MKATGDVGRLDDIEQRVVVADSVGTEAFTKIGIEVDFAHRRALQDSAY